jgi:hypothetical protein
MFFEGDVNIMERKVERYTVRDLILGTRKAYLKEYEELNKLKALVQPIDGLSSEVNFRLSGSILSSELVCDVIRKTNKLDKLLRRKKKYTYDVQSCGVIPYVHKDAEQFEDIKDGIMASDYFNKMGFALRFNDNHDHYLLQTTVEDIRLNKYSSNVNKEKEILFTGGDTLYLGNDTEIADALNMLNARLPINHMSEYHRSLMESVEDPFALRIVDARKANEIQDTKSIVVLAKRM